jgi:hypothetical protein
MKSHITESLIYDYISLPLAPYQAISKKVNHKRLSKVAHIICRQFDRVFKTLGSFLIHFMTLVSQTKIKEFIRYSYRMKGCHPQQEEIDEIKYLTYFEEIYSSDEKSSIDSIITILEDNFIMKDNDSIKIWISMCFIDLVKFDMGSESNTSPGLNSVSINTSPCV